MSEVIKAYPLQWPAGWKRARHRVRAQFGKAVRQYSLDNQSSWTSKGDLTIADAVQRVRLELDRMDIRDADIVISTNLHLRLDGLPKSGQAQPADPGAAVYWRTKDGQRCMAIDQYDRVDHNLAAIAATMYAMRAIKRHGGAEILDRAFTGFIALPAPMAAGKPWRQVLGFDLDYTPTADDVRAQHRVRRGEAHPDRKGGEHEEFLAVQAAYEQAARELGFTP